VLNRRINLGSCLELIDSKSKIKWHATVVPSLDLGAISC